MQYNKTRFVVSIKTASHVKIKRSWIYDDVDADNAADASDTAITRACHWWSLAPRDIVVVSAKEYVAPAKPSTDYGNCLKCGLPMQVLDMSRGIQCPKCWV